MADKEKIESLKQCLSASCRGFRTCPYSDTEWDAIKTALELLEEQEPVEPIRQEGFSSVKCGKCNSTIPLYCIYCPFCGKKVKWNG